MNNPVQSCINWLRRSFGSDRAAHAAKPIEETAMIIAARSDVAG